MFKTSTKTSNLENSLLGELEGALSKRKSTLKTVLDDSDSDEDFLTFLKKDGPKTMVNDTQEWLHKRIHFEILAFKLSGYDV